MNLLLDTHLLLWAAAEPERIAPAARELIEDPANALHYSAASLWEVAIKSDLGRADFKVDAALLRRGLMDGGYVELAIAGHHAVAVGRLPAIHRDPFDRMLIAQATTDGMLLLTADELVAAYPGPIRRV